MQEPTDKELPPELNPDGLRIVVPWGDFRPGESVFIPCINHARARAQLALIAKWCGYKLRTRFAIEHGILGLRVWRTHDMG